MAFILIVDDEETVCERAADALIAAGHACGWVISAEQARTLLRWRSPELVLVNEEACRLPVESVREQLDPAQRDIPIILLSPHCGGGTGVGKVVDGAQDCIRKPFDPRFLVWRVSHALEVYQARLAAEGRTLLEGEEKRRSIA